MEVGALESYMEITTMNYAHHLDTREEVCAMR